MLFLPNVPCHPILRLLFFTMSNPPLLETARLQLRLLSQADFDFYYRLQSDPDTMRYIRPPEPDPAMVRARIDTLMEYAQNNPGLGSMIAFWKETPEPVATCVLRHVDYQPENDLELGYVITPAFQGRGLATEIARALADYAFRCFPAPKVVAVTDPENIVSQKVLLKCGFVEMGRRFIYGSDCLEFALFREV